MTRIVVDRVEGDLAVLEVGERTIEWPLSLLPAGVGEGSTLDVTFALVPPESAALDEAKARLARLRARNKPPEPPKPDEPSDQ